MRTRLTKLTKLKANEASGMQDIQETISLLDRMFYGSDLVALPIGGGVLSVLFFSLIIYLAFHTAILPEFINDFVVAWNKGVVPASTFGKRWVRIQRLMGGGDEYSWHKAIIEADDILDAILQRIGYDGATMDERLAKVQEGQLPNLEDARKAHHVRMYFDHDPSYRISREAAEKVIEIYENIFTSLGVL